MTFYPSILTAIQHIRSKAARADAYDAICAYAFHETVPDLDRLPPPAAMAFEAAQPVLDAGRRKAQSGAAGGAARSAGSTAEAADKNKIKINIKNKCSILPHGGAAGNGASPYGVRREPRQSGKRSGRQWRECFRG